MAGEIHGIISREEAWKSWQPFGDRIKLDGSIDPAQLNHVDALQIVYGSGTADRDGEQYRDRDV